MQWEEWAAQLCGDLSAAGQKLAESFKKGGLAAARAFNATNYNCTPDGTYLLEMVSGMGGSVPDVLGTHCAAGSGSG